MKLCIIVTTLILIIGIGTFPHKDSMPATSSEDIDLVSTREASNLALASILELQAEVSDLVDHLNWVIYEIDIYYDFRLRIGAEISALQSTLDEKVNSLAGLVANFVPVQERVAALRSLLKDVEEADEFTHFVDKAYDSATDMRRGIESVLQVLQTISHDLAQTQGAREGERE